MTRTRSSLPTIAAALAVTVVILGLVGVPADARAAGQGPATPDGVVAYGSVEQVAVTGLEPNVQVRLQGPRGHRQESVADAFGSTLFRDVPPGGPYLLQVRDGTRTLPIRVPRVLSADEHPGPDTYSGISLEAGYVTTDTPSRGDVAAALHRGYFPARDGILLSYSAILPGPPEDGPYPALIDYSGYNPGHSEGGLWHRFVAEGYAVFGVNMRGSGCSGGAFDYFEWLQALDGYDAVETIAAQDWVDGVGMIGWSWAGISQLFVGAAQPPSLDALVPGSAVGDLYRDVLRPGGIRNDGFGLFFADVLDQETAPPVLWMDDAYDHRAHYPRPPYGGSWDNLPGRTAGWLPARLQTDPTCAANHALRLQNELLLPRAAVEAPDPDAFITPWMEERAPENHVARISAPTLLLHTWHDEQTAGRAAQLLQRFDPDVVRFIGTNGDHREYNYADVWPQLLRHLDLHVKKAVPSGETHASHAEALATYESEDPIRIHLETVETDPGPWGDNPFNLPNTAVIQARQIETFPSWPVADETDALRLHLQPGGGLTSAAPAPDGGSTAYTASPSARPEAHWGLGISFGWHQTMNPWRPVASDASAAWVTEPLTADHAFVGPGSVDLWLASDTEDTDVEVTLSEIRPDGSEVYVQSGWLRASHRTLDSERSIALWPVQTQSAADWPAPPLAQQDYTQLRIEVYPFGHLFHAGSRIKLTVEAPGGNRLTYRFSTLPGTQQNRIAHDAAHPSALVLPLVPAVSADNPPIDRCWADSGRAYLNSQPCLAGTD